MKQVRDIIIIGSFITIFIMMSLIGVQHDYNRQKGNGLTFGCQTFGEGISSIPLSIETSQLIHFDKRTGARIYLEKQEIEENFEHHIIGNIDFVIINPSKKNNLKERWKQYELFVVLRNQFDLRYKIAENGKTLELIGLDIYSMPVSKYTHIFEQKSQQTYKNEFYYRDPLEGTLMVDFENILWNITSIYNWKYEIIIDETDLVTLTLKAI